MAFDFPASPTNGQIYSPAGGPDYVWNSTTGAWEIKTSGTNSAFVAKSGDTMSGGLTISKPDAILSLADRPGGTVGSAVYGYSGDTITANARWGLVLGNAAAETGANVGSDFGLLRYSDTGTQLGSLFMRRSNGEIIHDGDVTITKALPVFSLNKSAATSEAHIKASYNNKYRWVLTLGDSSPETPANAGSNFLLSRYDDAGNYINSPYSIDRLKGDHRFEGSMSLRKPAGGSTPYINLYSGGGTGAVTGIIGYGPNDAARWSINLGDGAAEGAEGIGNNFAIWRCNNAGAGVQAALLLNRSDGGATLQNVSATMVSVSAQYGRVFVNCAAGNNNSAILFSQNNVNRWSFETGASPAQDFAFTRYTDAGEYLGGIWGVNRANGEMTLAAQPISAMGVCTKSYADARVTKTGDTMTGSLYITGSYPSLILKRTDQTANQILGMSISNEYRWVIALGNTPEYGGHTGSDFSIGRFGDGGAHIDNPISILRQTGDVSFSGFLYPRGYKSKQGYNGAQGGNIWNYYWYGEGGGMQMWVDTSYIGIVTTSSDYRIKKDIAPLTSMWEKIKALKPISYTHKEFGPSAPPDPIQMLAKEGGEFPVQHPAGDKPLIAEDNIERWGFVAHELQETLIPTAATGVKDQENCIQSPNWAPIVAALTKALQEAMERIEALEEKIGAQPKAA